MIREIKPSKPESHEKIISALQDALAMAHDASFEHVTIVMRIGEKSHVIVRSDED